MPSGKKLLLLAAAAIFLTLGHNASADPAQKDHFETSLYGVAQIHHFSVPPDTFDTLTTVQREDILLAKKALVDGLTALGRKNGDVTAFMSAPLKHRFPTTRAFAGHLTSPETSMLAILVSGFAVEDAGKRIILNFSAITSSEGVIVANDRKATMTITDGSWKIDDIR